MPDQDSSLDLRLTPDWLKDPEPANRYADFEGEDSGDRSFRGRGNRRDDRPRRSSAPSSRRSDPGSRPANRPPGSDRRPIQNRGQRPDRPRQGEPSASSPPGYRGDRNRPRREDPEASAPAAEPAPVQIDFLPEERAFSKIIQQIKQGHTAYPLFGLARMFLERPERHRVRIRSIDNSTMIYQLGESGRVAMDPAILERMAFTETKDEFYESVIVEKEPIKGNFTSVARCTLSGKLLGPTNYHTFQSAIRSLYEQRFSRRMTFEDYRRSIEITTNPDAVNQWKEEARRVTTYRTKDEENPESFENLGTVENHFRSHYLPAVVKPCLATEISGESARNLPDRSIVASIRKARDRENRFPAQIAGALRHGLNQAGLHVFKHKKRILYISTVRPQLFDPNQASVSSDLGAILTALRSFPKITRKQLAEKVLTKLLGEKAADDKSPEYQQARTSLATDLIWLAKAGHVIEFADGTLDLPLPPKNPESKPAAPALGGPVPSPLRQAGHRDAASEEEIEEIEGPSRQEGKPESFTPDDSEPAVPETGTPLAESDTAQVAEPLDEPALPETGTPVAESGTAQVAEPVELGENAKVAAAEPAPEAVAEAETAPGAEAVTPPNEVTVQEPKHESSPSTAPESPKSRDKWVATESGVSGFVG